MWLLRLLGLRSDAIYVKRHRIFAKRTKCLMPSQRWY